VTTPNRFATIHAALDNGVNFLDNRRHVRSVQERSVGRFGHPAAAKRSRARTKFGNERGEDGTYLGINGRPEYVLKACEASLRRLGVDVMICITAPSGPWRTDRRDLGRHALARRGREGSPLGHLGGFFGDYRTRPRGAPVTALQSEYSLWTRDPEDDVLDTCRRLGVGFVAYSPLGGAF